MTYERIQISRQELYEEIWSEPVATVAKRYGISDVGLAKLCSRLDIPRPGRGYWEKKRHDRAPRRPPLPKLKDGRSDVTVITRQKKPPADPQQNSEALVMIANEGRDENRIQVTPPDAELHPLLARTEKSLRGAKVDDRDLVKPRAKHCLDINVSQDSVDRAVRIMDALVKALEVRGYAVAVQDEPKRMTTVTVLEEALEFALEEAVLYKERELTPAELKRKEREPWAYRYPQYDIVTTGRLALKIRNVSLRGARLTWADGKRQRVEDCLNDFVIGLINAAVRKRADRLERERREREWAEERRRREERARLIREEKERLQQLEMDAESWRKSQAIRAYLNAVQQEAIRKHGEVPAGSELERWLIWAVQQADRLDPLVDSPPSILDEQEDYRYW
ncbi:MAG: hypothetical protein IT488_05125 [Gammaproteobacteria bacterium]|nr:hypothetical protein [Gammaproteobacteria bacterium]